MTSALPRLVTGAAGFVGRWLVEELRAHGETVVGADRVPGAGRHTLDLLDARAVTALLEETQPAVVYHLAAQSSAGRSFHDPAGTVAVNVLGALHLIEGVRALPTGRRPRLVVIGSAEEYGPAPSRSPFHERSPAHPVSPYGVSKLAQTHLCLQAAGTWGLDVVVARPFPHVGPGQAECFAYPSWAVQIAAAERGEREPVLDVGCLEPVRDLMHVRDVVRAYRLLADPDVPGGVYNVCSGRGTSMQTGLDILCEEADVEVRLRTDPERIRPSDIPWLVGDGTKLRAATGWSPQIEPRIALRELLQWTRENRT